MMLGMLTHMSARTYTKSKQLIHREQLTIGPCISGEHQRFVH